MTSEGPSSLIALLERAQEGDNVTLALENESLKAELKRIKASIRDSGRVSDLDDVVEAAKSIALEVVPPYAAPASLQDGVMSMASYMSYILETNTNLSTYAEAALPGFDTCTFLNKVKKYAEDIPKLGIKIEDNREAYAVIASSLPEDVAKRVFDLIGSVTTFITSLGPSPSIEHERLAPLAQAMASKSQKPLGDPCSIVLKALCTILDSTCDEFQASMKMFGRIRQIRKCNEKSKLAGGSKYQIHPSFVEEILVKMKAPQPTEKARIPNAKKQKRPALEDSFAHCAIEDVCSSDDE